MTSELSEILLKFTVAAVLLVTVRYCDVPPHSVTVPKLTLGDENAIAEMKFAVTLSGSLMVTVVEALLALATGPVQLKKT